MSRDGPAEADMEASFAAVGEGDGESALDDDDVDDKLRARPSWRLAAILDDACRRTLLSNVC